MNYRCIIVDDEPLSHDALKKYLEKFNQLQIVGSFFNARDAAEFLEINSVDMLFMDIRFLELNGPEILRAFQSRPVSIITTPYRSQTLRSTVDHLLKPFYTEQFEKTVNQTLNFYNLVNGDNTIDFNGEIQQYEILIKSGARKILVDYRKIAYAQGLKDYTILYTDDEKYVVKGSVKASVSYLPKDHFVRVHKSFVVGINKIKVIHKNRIEFNNIAIPIGRHYRDVVKDLLLKSGNDIRVR